MGQEQLCSWTPELQQNYRTWSRKSPFLRDEFLSHSQAAPQLCRETLWGLCSSSGWEGAGPKEQREGRFCAVQIPRGWQVSMPLSVNSALQHSAVLTLLTLHGIIINGQQEPPGAAQRAGIKPNPSCSSHTHTAAAVRWSWISSLGTEISRGCSHFPVWNLPLCRELIPVS